MRILVIGGKKFAGYAIVREALARGHEVTLFNRGLTYPELWPELPCVTGDRLHDLHKLDGMEFDAVIDPCCYFPHQMRESAGYFRGKGVFYAFISTLSVCDLTRSPVLESDPLPSYDYSEAFTEEMGNYGPLKAACEAVLQETLGDSAAMIRPGFICGERDHTDRFTYWPVKMHLNDAVIVPENDFPFQFIDVRDLAAFTLTVVEQRLSGPFSVTGPGRPYRFSDFLQDCRDAVNPRCRLVRLSDAKLDQLGLLRPDKCMYFPLFYGETPGFDGLYSVDVSRALAAGLTCRPARDTLTAARDWFLSRSQNGDDLAVGLKLSREREILRTL